RKCGLSIPIKQPTPERPRSDSEAPAIGRDSEVTRGRECPGVPAPPWSAGRGSFGFFGAAALSAFHAQEWLLVIWQHQPETPVGSGSRRRCGRNPAAPDQKAPILGRTPNAVHSAYEGDSGPLPLPPH